MCSLTGSLHNFELNITEYQTFPLVLVWNIAFCWHIVCAFGCVSLCLYECATLISAVCRLCVCYHLTITCAWIHVTHFFTVIWFSWIGLFVIKQNTVGLLHQINSLFVHSFMAMFFVRCSLIYRLHRNAVWLFYPSFHWDVQLTTNAIHSSMAFSVTSCFEIVVCVCVCLCNRWKCFKRTHSCQFSKFKSIKLCRVHVL